MSEDICSIITIGFIQLLGFNPKNKMVNPFHKKE